MRTCQQCGCQYARYGDAKHCRTCYAEIKADESVDWFAARLRQHVICSAWPRYERRSRAVIARIPVQLQVVCVADVTAPNVSDSPVMDDLGPS